MEQTHSYSNFSIESNGQIDSRGLVAYPDGVFDPDEITALLGIKPFCKWKKGDLRKCGREYGFSFWETERSAIGRLDVEAQCLEIIKLLKDKIPILQEIKAKYNVNFILMVVPNIYGEEQPQVRFNEEIIEFCYLTGTIINMDMYIYQNRNE